MIQPVQRIPRYILLLSDLTKNTTSEYNDFEDLNKALQAIKTTADNINESKRNFESQQRLKSIEENFTKPLPEVTFNFNQILIFSYFNKKSFFFIIKLETCTSWSKLSS